MVRTRVALRCPLRSPRFGCRKGPARPREQVPFWRRRNNAGDSQVFFFARSGDRIYADSAGRLGWGGLRDVSSCRPKAVVAASDRCVVGYIIGLAAEALARLFGTAGPLPNLEPTWNMAPTKAAPIVRFDREAGERRLEVVKWGLVPFFTKDLAKARKPINARSETVARSPLFKEAFARRRCLVPAAAYYEWRHDPSGKTPFAIARNDGEPVALGGMWETWQSGGETLRTFATLTTDANPCCRSPIRPAPAIRRQ